MTPQSPEMSEPPPEFRSVRPLAMSPTAPLYWSVRRELWEYRSIAIVPLCAAALVLVGSMIHAAGLPADLQLLSTLDATRQGEALAKRFSAAEIPIVISMFIVSLFYCIGALHSERRDRSILFWKSLPISDFTVVVSKATTILVILPLIIFAATLVTEIVILAISSFVLIIHGINPLLIWTEPPLLQMLVILAYTLVTLTLWYAPVYAWLLLVSGWARRAPFLWAVLPPLGICLVEHIAFHSHHALRFLAYRLGGIVADSLSNTEKPGTLVDHLSQLDPLKFLSSPSLWTGLAATIAFIAASVWLRRYREPI